MSSDAGASVDTNFGVVPLGHLVALFEIVNDVNAVRAAQVEHEVIAFACGLPHDGLDFVVGDLVGCVHVFELLCVPKAIMCDFLGQSLSQLYVFLKLRKLFGGYGNILLLTMVFEFIKNLC